MRWWEKLREWRIDDELVLAPEDHGEMLAALGAPRWRGQPTWETRETILERTSAIPLIRDDNMVTEWGAGETFP